MRHLMLFVGMGTALVAAAACRATPASPLTAAAARNDTDAVRRLLAKGHPPDEDGDALTPLMWAARNKGIDAMKVLLDAGAAVDRRDHRNGWTALQHAIHTRAVDAVRLLLERGADPNASDHPGALTPLLMAASEANPAVLKLLLAYGADPRVQGEWGDTPLTRAVSGGALADIDRGLFGGCHPATVRALLDHDPTLRVPDTAAGRQALMWARLHTLQASTRETVHGLATGTSDGAASRSGHGDRCREVLDLVRDGVAPTRAQR